MGSIITLFLKNKVTNFKIILIKNHYTKKGPPMLYQTSHHHADHSPSIAYQYLSLNYFLQNQVFKFFEEIAEISHNYEGNWGKNLEEIIEDLSFCHYCMKYQKDISEGTCPHCSFS